MWRLGRQQLPRLAGGSGAASCQRRCIVVAPAASTNNTSANSAAIRTPQQPQQQLGRSASPGRPAPQRTPATAPVSAAPSLDPTFVPRDPAVKDGPWNAVDARLVASAQQDAAATPARPAAADGDGRLVLLGRSEAELRQLLEGLGHPGFRGKQVLDALLQGVRSIDDMRLLPAKVKADLLAAGAVTGRSALHAEAASPDGTRKLLLQQAEGRVIETVGIPTLDEGKPRLTVCVSSQVGCPMRCTFCATGQGGFARNLTAAEILDQVLWVRELFGTRVSNVVFMGMGEPCLNLGAVVAAYQLLNGALGIGGRSITISTVGVPNTIRRLSGLGLSATLAVSIHAPNQALREQLVPSAKAYPLAALMQDCEAYFMATGRRVTYEYTLMAGVNDEPAHAAELATLLRSHKQLKSHVNLIPWNPVDDTKLKRPSRARVEAFQKVLETAGLPVSVRSTRGLEAAAACGQLRNRFQKQPVPQPQALG